MKWLSPSYVSHAITTAVGLLAACQGSGAAPTAPRDESPATTASTLIDIRNAALPPAVERAITKGYNECIQRTEQNSRIFGDQTPLGIQTICTQSAGERGAFQLAMSTTSPSELTYLLHALNGLNTGRPERPLLELNRRHLTGEQLLQMNRQDYEQSGSINHQACVNRLADLLRPYIAPEQRVSMKAARAAANTPPCRHARRGLVSQLTREQIDNRKTLARMRLVGSPDTMTLDQLDDLCDDLDALQFGRSPIKRDLVNSALKQLVAEHRGGKGNGNGTGTGTPRDEPGRV